MNPKVDAFIERQDQWKEEFEELRAILLGFELDELVKWGKPTYALPDGGNIAILQPFKKYGALLFFKGALLDDPEGLLERTGPNTQAGRQIRFTSPEHLTEHEDAIRAIIAQAIENERNGLEVEMKEPDDHTLPVELQDVLDADPEYAAAFDSLTPGRRRSWALHISGAKQEKTRISRAEKAKAAVLDGKGWNER